MKSYKEQIEEPIAATLTITIQLDEPEFEAEKTAAEIAKKVSNFISKEFTSMNTVSVDSVGY